MALNLVFLLLMTTFRCVVVVIVVVVSLCINCVKVNSSGETWLARLATAVAGPRKVLKLGYVEQAN